MVEKNGSTFDMHKITCLQALTVSVNLSAETFVMQLLPALLLIKMLVAAVPLKYS